MSLLQIVAVVIVALGTERGPLKGAYLGMWEWEQVWVWVWV